MTAARRWLLATEAVAVATLLVLTAGPTYAGAGHQPPPAATGPTVVQPVSNCVIFHSVEQFGKDCTDGTLGPPIKDLPGGNNPNLCRYDAAPDSVEAELSSQHPSPPELPGKAYLKTCVTNIDVNLPVALQRNLTVTETYQWIHDDNAVITDPPPGIALFNRLTSSYPAPVLEYGPAFPLRVNLNDYAWLTPDSQQSKRIGVTGADVGNTAAQTVTMWAALDTNAANGAPVQILPGTQVAGHDVTLDCNGTIAWQGTAPQAQRLIELQQPPPGACVLKYAASSVSEANPQDHGKQSYEVTVTSRFQVFYQVGNDAPQAMPGTVTKTAQVAVEVDEIQTLNR